MPPGLAGAVPDDPACLGQMPHLAFLGPLASQAGQACLQDGISIYVLLTRESTS